MFSKLLMHRNKQKHSQIYPSQLLAQIPKTAFDQSLVPSAFEPRGAYQNVQVSEPSVSTLNSQTVFFTGNTSNPGDEFSSTLPGRPQKASPRDDTARKARPDLRVSGGRVH